MNDVDVAGLAEMRFGGWKRSQWNCFGISFRHWYWFGFNFTIRTYAQYRTRAYKFKGDIAEKYARKFLFVKMRLKLGGLGETTQSIFGGSSLNYFGQTLFIIWVGWEGGNEQ